MCSTILLLYFIKLGYEIACFYMASCVSFLLVSPCLTYPTSFSHTPTPHSILSILPHCFDFNYNSLYSNDTTTSPKDLSLSLSVSTCTPDEMHKTEDLKLGSQMRASIWHIFLELAYLIHHIFSISLHLLAYSMISFFFTAE